MEVFPRSSKINECSIIVILNIFCRRLLPTISSVAVPGPARTLQFHHHLLELVFTTYNDRGQDLTSDMAGAGHWEI